MSRQVSSNTPRGLSPEQGAGVPDLREVAISPGATGSDQSPTEAASAGPSEVPITETPPTASDPVNCNHPDSVDLGALPELAFGNGMKSAIDSALDGGNNGQDTDEITIDWLPGEGRDASDRMPLTALGTAVGNHRHGRPQEDRHYAGSFPALTVDQAVGFLTDSIAKIDAHTRDHTSGSTLTSVVVTQDGELVTAHLGDSPASAIIIDRNGARKRTLLLTKDHKPTNENKIREAVDGTVFVDSEDRRWVAGVGNINMTRALGDSIFGAALSHEPEVKSHRVQRRLKPGDRLFLLLSSDGAHNEKKGITHSVHAKTLANGLQRKLSLDQIAGQIAESSRDIKDNVTVLLLEVEVGKGAVLGVFDGHGGSETSQRACDLFKTYVETFLGS